MIRGVLHYVIDDEPASDGDELLTPYVRLWTAVLYQGIQDYVKCLTNHKNGDTQDAERWVHSQSLSFGSFRWICELIDVCPEKIRKKCQEQCNEIAKRRPRAS